MTEHKRSEAMNREFARINGWKEQLTEIFAPIIDKDLMEIWEQGNIGPDTILLVQLLRLQKPRVVNL